MTDQKPIILRAIEPSPSRVNYEAARNRVIYTAPNVAWGWRTESPSDCIWIVPGTGS